MVKDGGVQEVENRGENNTIAKCKVGPIPRKNFELSNVGEGAIKSHVVGEKHCERLAFYKKIC